MLYDTLHLLMEVPSHVPSHGLQDGRVVFLLPWQGAMVAGTTDEPCTVTPRPLASGKEVDFILEALRDYLGIEVSSARHHCEGSEFRSTECRPVWT